MSHELWKRLQLFQVLLVGKQVETSIFFALYCGNAPHNLVGKEYNMESPWKNLTQSKHSVQCFLAFQTGLMCTLHIYKANLLRASALWAGRIQYSGCPFTHVRMLSLFFKSMQWAFWNYIDQDSDLIISWVTPLTLLGFPLYLVINCLQPARFMVTVTNAAQTHFFSSLLQFERGP